MATQQETTNPAGERENNEIQALCLSAFEAERQKNWKLAFDLHNQSITRLNSIIAKQTGWFTNETKRIAQKQTKFHAVRRDFIRGLANGVPGAKEPVLLPTHQSAVESLMEVKPDGTRTISSVSHSTTAKDVANSSRTRFSSSTGKPSKPRTQLSPHHLRLLR